MKTKIKITAFVMTLVLVITIIPSAVFAQSKKEVDYTFDTFSGMNDENLTIATISDMHYFPDSLKGGRNKAYKKYCENSVSLVEVSGPAFDLALDELASKLKNAENPYLVISGDLTHNGEYEAHKEISQKLKAWEQKTGISVIVINGNHDINNSASTTFANGKKEKARITTPQEFFSFYKDLGYDLAYHRFDPETNHHGMGSYSVKLGNGYRLIMMDSNVYTADKNEKGNNEHQTGGLFTKELLDWVKSECTDAKKDGEEIIGVTHCSVIEHLNSFMERVLQGFIINNWEYYAGELADSGMHYVYCGHSHSADIASYVSDNGNIIYECESPSISTGIGYYITKFATNSGKIAGSYKYYDIDENEPIVIDGVKQKQPYKYEAFNQEFGNGSLAELAVGAIEEKLTYIIEETNKTGSIVSYIEKKLGVNLEEFITQYFDGLKIGEYELFSAKNLTSFANDILSQFTNRYLTSEEFREKFVTSIVEKLSKIEVSTLPCDKFIDTIGFGSKDKPGTFENAVYSTIYYFTFGNENIDDDEFMKDTINNFKKDTVLSKKIFFELLDILLNDILEDELLPNIELNITSLFPEGTFGNILAQILDKTFTALLGGSKDLMSIINKVFSIDIIPYESLKDIIDKFLDDYMTESQYQSIGFEFAEIISKLSFDCSPREKGDLEATYTYTGLVPVEASEDNFRLPSIISTTFGENSSSFNISWYTKDTVKGTDIEIIPYSENPVFTGTPTVSESITSSCEPKLRFAQGIDFGIVGVMEVTKYLNRHIINIKNLQSGTKYCYRIGDASRNWWSEPGILKTADSSDKVTFFHVSDDQSQNKEQYQTFANLLDTAYRKYPDVDFIINTGDIADLGSNVEQWAWALNNSTLRKTVMMPTAGNHDNHLGSENAVVDNFMISNAPKQDTSTGIYYSFDYNNIHMAVLNTNDLSAFESLSCQQITWLKNDMLSSNARWKFVALHKAIYSNGSHYDDDDVCQIRKQLSVLMPELGIDMVFQGHDHVYLRTDAMDSNKIVAPKTKEITHDGETYNAKIDPKGTVYVISACSGVKYYLTKDASLTDEYFPRAEKIVDCTLPAFSSIQIDGDNLYFDAFTVENKSANKIDSFAISKTPASDSQKAEKEVFNTFNNLLTSVFGESGTFISNICYEIIYFSKKLLEMI